MDTNVVIVNGAGGYVGSAVARMLTERGMKVALWYHRTEPALTGPHCRSYQVDLTDADAVEAALEAVAAEMGTPVAAVHAAGIAPSRKKFLDSSPHEMQEQLNGNALTGFIFLTACASVMKTAGKGALVGITTQAVADGASGAGLGPYVPAKRALKSILEQLAKELSGTGVSVHEVAPGFMDGGMNASLPRAFVELVKKGSASETLMTADDVAEEVVRHLVADAILSAS